MIPCQRKEMFENIGEDMSTLKTVLSIAGSDTIGGAGIQADIKTMQANGVYAMSVISALTAQNTMGVRDVYEVSEKFMKSQLDAVFEDIFPDAVKIGMVSSKELIGVIAERLRFYRAEKIVLDPVLISTSGTFLLKEDAIESLKEQLFPLTTLLTPNIPETEWLTKKKILSKEDRIEAAAKIAEEYGCAVLCKGGHIKEQADDLLYDKGEVTWFEGKHIENPNTHGTGCTLSSAIASNLAKGWNLKDSVRRGKEYVSGAIMQMLALGKGSGPLDHGFERNPGKIYFNVTVQP